MTRKIKDGKPVTPTLRDRTHVQTERYLKVHCASLYHLVVGTITKGTQVYVVVASRAKIDDPNRFAPINNGCKLKFIERDHVVALVDDVAETRGRVAAARCRIALSTFFKWAIDGIYCEKNPTFGVQNRAAESLRSRPLSHQELGEVLARLSRRRLLQDRRLLLLTGQRKREMDGLRWSEINPEYHHVETPDGEEQEHVLPLIMPPPPRCRTSSTMIRRGIDFHLVPMSEQVLEIVNSAPRSVIRPRGQRL